MGKGPWLDMTLLVFVVLVLAVYRLTLLVTSDELTEPIREAVVARFVTIEHRAMRRVNDRTSRVVEWTCSCGETWEGYTSGADGMERFNTHVQTAPTTHREWLETLIHCPWCASVWLAFPAVAASYWWSDGWGWWLIAGPFAVSGAAGFLASYAKP